MSDKRIIEMDTTEVSICDCCLIKLANDDTSGHDYYCEGDPEPMAKLWADESVAMVTLGDGERDEFSRRECDGCGEQLAGARTTVTAWLKS